MFIFCFISLFALILAEEARTCTKNGQNFKERELYRHNRLRYRCENGIMNILGCYDDEGKEIEPGQDFRDKKNFKYHCYKKGLIVGFDYIPEPGSAKPLSKVLLAEKREFCEKNGQKFKQGEEYKNNHLLYRCKDGFMTVIGCYDDDGKSVEPGQDFKDQTGLRYHCYQNGTTIGYIYLPTISGTGEALKLRSLHDTCLHANGTFKEGQEYRHNHLRWRCEKGIMLIKGCYDSTNKDIEPGQNFLDGNFTFHCYKEGLKVGYYWVPPKKLEGKAAPLVAFQEEAAPAKEAKDENKAAPAEEKVDTKAIETKEAAPATETKETVSATEGKTEEKKASPAEEVKTVPATTEEKAAPATTKTKEASPAAEEVKTEEKKAAPPEEFKAAPATEEVKETAPADAAKADPSVQDKSEAAPAKEPEKAEAKAAPA